MFHILVSSGKFNDKNIEMARCLFVIISLLVILVERGYSEKGKTL
jgi:hypothetical protein